jgi:hypothetical protein
VIVRLASGLPGHSNTRSRRSRSHLVGEAVNPAGAALVHAVPLAVKPSRTHEVANTVERAGTSMDSERAIALTAAALARR